MPKFRHITGALALVASIAACGATGNNITATSNTATTTTGSAARGETATATEPASTSTGTSSKPATPDITGLPLGRMVNATGSDEAGRSFEMTVTAKATRTAKQIDEFTVSSNGEFFGVQVQYVCTKGTCQYNPFDFTLRNRDGETLDMTYGFKPGLESGTLKRGVKAQGWLTFDTKPGQKLSLEYQVNPFDEEVASWKVKS